MARPKEFDEDIVLQKAMQLFWEQGYEKTSMHQLVAHMGIHKGSLYDTFGEKKRLYNLALQRYCEQYEASINHRVEVSHSAKETIQQLFERAIREREDKPQGCFIVNTAVELSSHDAEARDRVSLNWERVEEIIRNLILQGQQSGEFSETLDSDQLASCLNNALIGLRVMVKTNPDKEKLSNIIKVNMSLLK
ncbi:TetR/AcrR family transcriptional regulator [Paenibacillus sp. CF384]|uniref:TetR/AcrR family transcriptional regulator n=1 Tax=Paenibacillus sp. CF384 TaxID=1884382 RepID=UPI00089AA97F|nr:TetR/AcrR family transcriptional regulator [Paenibacillus sp. CF384]SDW07248.1 transcriptional regulator, TetR family [Paenibacillus sp. CF384]